MDSFAALGLEPTLEIDAAELERVHLRLSRECHPDHHQQGSADEQIAVLQRSAQLNDAYRELLDPWRRAVALLELRDPGVIDRTKKLDAAFLMRAMDIAEEVAEATDASRQPLAGRLREAVASHWARIVELSAADDWSAAATTLHQSRYYRKALEDLET